MSKYRRTIVTLDDTQSKRDYMLFCVFEKLWPDMILPSPLHSHPKGKDFNDDGRFDICVHIDEINIDANGEWVVDNDAIPEKVATQVDSPAATYDATTPGWYYVDNHR